MKTANQNKKESLKIYKLFSIFIWRQYETDTRDGVIRQGCQPELLNVWQEIPGTIKIILVFLIHLYEECRLYTLLVKIVVTFLAFAGCNVMIIVKCYSFAAWCTPQRKIFRLWKYVNTVISDQNRYATAISPMMYNLVRASWVMLNSTRF